MRQINKEDKTKWRQLEWQEPAPSSSTKREREEAGYDDDDDEEEVKEEVRCVIPAAAHSMSVPLILFKGSRSIGFKEAFWRDDDDDDDDDEVRCR